MRPYDLRPTMSDIRRKILRAKQIILDHNGNKSASSIYNLNEIDLLFQCYHWGRRPKTTLALYHMYQFAQHLKMLQVAMLPVHELFATRLNPFHPTFMELN